MIRTRPTAVQLSKHMLLVRPTTPVPDRIGYITDSDSLDLERVASCGRTPGRAARRGDWAPPSKGIRGQKRQVRCRQSVGARKFGACVRVCVCEFGAKNFAVNKRPPFPMNAISRLEAAILRASHTP